MVKRLIFILYNSWDFSSVILVHALVNMINRDIPIEKLEEMIQTLTNYLVAKKLK